MDSALTFDIVTQRAVYPLDWLIGMRKWDLDKGTEYNVSVGFTSGNSPLSGFPVSGFGFSLAAPNRNDTPFVSVSGLSDSGLSFQCASPVLDFAIQGKDSLLAESDFVFTSQGVDYSICSLPTRICNNSTLSPQQEYYPLNSNPSGYEQAADFQSFNYPLPSGASSAFIPFSPAFSQIPVVAYSFDIPASGSLYAVGTSGITVSGFGVYLSDSLDMSGYSLSVVARV